MMKKKVLLPVIGIALAAAVAVVFYGANAGWFSKKPDKPKQITDPDKPQPKPKPKDKMEELITTEGLARLESLKKANAKKADEAIARWAKEPDLDRRFSWQAVRVGAERKQDRQTRMRACQLAAALAQKPADAPVPPPADASAVNPLLSCFKSGDPGLITQSTTALCTMNQWNPTFKIKEKMVPEVRKLLASDDPDVAGATLTAAAGLKEISLAPDIVAAWERHAKVKGFTDRCCQKLRTVLELQVRYALKKENPSWDRRKEMEETRKRLPKLFEQLGRDPAKWKAYWAKVLGTADSKAGP